MLHDFPHSRRGIMLPQPDHSLNTQNQRKKQRQAKQVIHITLRESSTNVVRLQIPSVHRVNDHRREADGIAEEVKFGPLIPNQCPLAAVIWKKAITNPAMIPTIVVAIT